MLLKAYSLLTNAKAEDVKAGECRNGFIHIIALFLTKTADGLINPKLVLAWLLTALSAPGWIIGVLVPVREAGALLPQMLIAQQVEQASQRKRIWALGSFGQGIAAIGIAATALLSTGVTAGIVILLLLTLLAFSRALASVSYKDVLARTIPKTRRGALTGLAASMGAGSVLIFGSLLAFGIVPLNTRIIAGVIAIAGLFWLAATVLFLTLDEPANRPEDAGQNEAVRRIFKPLLIDPQLRILICARALLAVTALAPPFIVMLSVSDGRDTIDKLGPFVLASAIASILSGYIWGRLADRSSRMVLILGGIGGAVVFAAIGTSSLLTGSIGGIYGSALAIFAAQLSYEGVRAGRKLHLTDMTGDDKRARYTALSNTAIGAALILGGFFGFMADAYGADWTLLLFSVMATLGALTATGLTEVQTQATAE